MTGKRADDRVVRCLVETRRDAHELADLVSQDAPSAALAVKQAEARVTDAGYRPHSVTSRRLAHRHCSRCHPGFQSQHLFPQRGQLGRGIPRPFPRPWVARKGHAFGC